MEIEKTINDQLQRNREESSKVSHQNREELSKSLDRFEEKFAKNIKDMREVIATQLKDIREDNSRQLEKMRETVDDKLQKTLDKRILIHKTGLKKRFPSLPNDIISSSWSGVVSRTRNSSQIFEKIDENIYVAGCYNGSGIGVGTLFGEQIAIKASNGTSEEIKIIDSSEPPIRPSAVLFGLIKGKILFLPNKFPNKYAPISISAVFKITTNKRRFPLIGSD